jgi:hypothetical protein
MALNTYSGLQASVANFLARTDLGTEIIDFIALTEAEFNRELRIRPMETTISFTIDAETETLPTGFLGVRSFFLNSSGKQVLTFITPYQQHQTQGSSTTGLPKAYSIEGSNFRFSPIPSGTSTETLTYYKAFDALSNTNTSNYILLNHPNVYLYGALYHASNFIRGIDPNIVAQWKEQFVNSINLINAHDEKESYNATPLVQRTDINHNNLDNVN